MAIITRQHGGSGAIEEIGRDIEWVLVNVSTWVSGDYTTTPNQEDSNLDIVVKNMAKHGTITFQGVAGANDLIFGMEGLGIDVDAIEIELEAHAAITAANATTVTLNGVTIS